MLKVALFHVTTEVSAASILNNGFIDGESRYMTNEVFRGVLLW